MPFTRFLLPFYFTVVLSAPVSTLAQEPLSVTPITVDGTPLTISPDGQWLAGTDADGDGFCVWATDTLDPSCDGALPAPVDARSITWSPDSSAVAFSLGASNRLVDSDIYLFDAASGTLANLTDDSANCVESVTVSAFAEPEQPVPIDRFPAWDPVGNRLVFARTLWGDPDASGVSLMTIPRDGGAPEEMARIEANGAMPIVGPMAWREDGSLLISIRHPDPADIMSGMWMLNVDGSLDQVLPGTFTSDVPLPILSDHSADGRIASVTSELERAENLGRVPDSVFYRVDLASGSATAWESVMDAQPGDTGLLVAPPVFGPDDTSVALLSRVPGNPLALSILDANGQVYFVTPVEYGEGRRPAASSTALDPAVFWADDGTIMVVLVTGATLITLSEGFATPATTTLASPAL